MTFNNVERPERIIQFGEGGFLHGFVDWMVQKLNDSGEYNGNIVVVQPIEKCMCDMFTNSRSFVSYPRHEYFRRILCNLLGKWVEEGEYPNDYNSLEKIVKGICYNNAKKYFGFETLIYSHITG